MQTVLGLSERSDMTTRLVYSFYYEECLCVTIDSGKTIMNNAVST